MCGSSRNRLPDTVGLKRNACMLLSRIARCLTSPAAGAGKLTSAAAREQKIHAKALSNGLISIRKLCVETFSPRSNCQLQPGSQAFQRGGISRTALGTQLVTSFRQALRGKATLAEPLAQTNKFAASFKSGNAAITNGLVSGLSRSTQKQLAVWLGGCAAWVFSMVVLGGLTRLTRSGLSMTDWKFTGERPPTSKADWESEFLKYKASPEFQKVNRSMALEEFKFIYWMEYAHRMWGRFLGLAFAGPALYFTLRGKINTPLAKRLGLLFLMGGTQGFVGWWMVRSGLQNPENQHEVPRVSPYRLAAHLGSAFLLYSILLWTSMSLAWPATAARTAAEVGAMAALRKWALPLTGLLAVTGMSGAFVAGLDAGHAYNTFPLMSGRVIPEEYWSIPGWRNSFENTAAVQFHHRVLALSTLTSVLATWILHRHSQLPRSSQNLLKGLAAVTAVQVTLGITTLLNYVPPSLGAAHQATALALFSTALALLFNLKPAVARAGPAMQLATPAAAIAVLLVGATVTQTT